MVGGHHVLILRNRISVIIVNRRIDKDTSFSCFLVSGFSFDPSP